MKIITTLLFLVFLTGCSAQGTIGTKQAAQTPSSTADDLPFLVYSRSGGFAGVNESWEIYSDGRVISKNGEVKMTSPEAARELLEQIHTADLLGLSQTNPKPVVCADCFTIELTLNNEGKQIHLSVVPESKDADPVAVLLVETVQNYIKSAH
jgi:hypothetical protein